MKSKTFMFFGLTLVLLGLIALPHVKKGYSPSTAQEQDSRARTVSYREIAGNVKKGETIYAIFKKHRLDIEELFQIKEASSDIHTLRKISAGNPYSILVDENDSINRFTYWVDDESCLTVDKCDDGFSANKTIVKYDRRIVQKGGVVTNNLIESLGEGRENLMLALAFSDIFAWDVDFTTDLQKGDTFKIVAEGFYLDGVFRKYGRILSAELTNEGRTHRAYHFELNGKVDYFDGEGNSLRRAFLKAPLSFRRISSGFSTKRFHPILKTYRAHRGVDYAAPHGTPVVSIGDGTVIFAGYRGQYGKLVIVDHPRSYSTYYGHLSRIEPGIRRGARVSQGQLLGAVGSTGLATGPHLHYELRAAGKPVNPLKVDLPKGEAIPAHLMAVFRDAVSEADRQLAAVAPVPVASAPALRK